MYGPTLDHFSWFAAPPCCSCGARGARWWGSSHRVGDPCPCRERSRDHSEGRSLHRRARCDVRTGHGGDDGDVGTALFAAACLDADPRFPIVDVI